MEQDQEYKNLVNAINDLELKINILGGGALELAKAKAKKEIDLQFDNFIKALEAKKEALYHDVDLKIQSLKNTQELQLQTTRQLLSEARRSLSAGSLVYGQHPKLAGDVWKKSTTGSNDPIGTVDVTFPMVPPGVIENFGAVITANVPPSQYPVLSQQSLQNKSDESSTKQDLDQRLKILLIGDSQVGKSCMLQQFIDNTFTLNSLPTIGADFKITTVTLNGKPVKLQIWDMSGKDRFRALAPGFLKGADGIIITYDITSGETLGSIKHWLIDVDNYAPNAIKIIVGNKSDLTPRAVDFDVAKKLAEQIGIPYLETSATDPRTIREAFSLLITKVVQTLEQQQNPSLKNTSSPPVKKDDCIVQ